MQSKWCAVLLLVLGCATPTTVQVTALNPWPAPAPARPPETVELFSSGPPRDRTYVDVAYLEAQQGEFSDANTQQFVGRLRTVAGRLGCDALVLGGITNARRDGVLDAQRTHKGLVATCIVYTDQLPTTISRAAPPR